MKPDLIALGVAAGLWLVWIVRRLNRRPYERISTSEWRTLMTENHVGCGPFVPKSYLPGKKRGVR